MFSIDEIRRNANERVTRFHAEAAAARHRRDPSRSFRTQAARFVRAIAAWIEPDASHPRGVPYASE